MLFPRKPTNEEIQDLKDWLYGIMYYNPESYTPTEEVRVMIEDFSIAIFDNYMTRGYYGKLMVTISDEGIIQLFIWNTKGRMESFYCSG